MSDQSFGAANKALLDNLDTLHIAGHGISLATLFGVMAGALPALAALGAVVWYAISIYETKTVQRWLRTRRARRTHKEGSHDQR